MVTEAVAVDERHEELEVLLLATVRRGGHQQQVPGLVAELASQLITLGPLDLAGPDMRAHLVCLIRNNEVPVDLRGALGQVLVAGQIVQARNP